MKMRKFYSLALLVLATISVNAQTEVADPVLMTVDGNPVTRGEFEAIYKKNNKDASVTKEALDEYLELFMNYKLKVREAEALGMDTVTKFRNELEGYRKQLARPYLIDRELNEALMQEAFGRMGQEVRASHILVSVGPDATPEDTLVAWKRISELRERVVKGEDFAAIAKSKGGSDDPSVAKNGGDLGYFSALQMVYPFETAAFTTEVGQVSHPVRTRFGYHIIKVSDKRPARGQVKVSHIMLRSTEEDPSEKQKTDADRIAEINRQIRAGEISFADAAVKYSEDESSNTKGGELPMFGTGKMIEEFEDASFALKADGDISEPVKTRYGWHIIQRMEYKAPPTFDEAKGELKNKIGKDSRAEITRNAFLEKLKKDYGVQVKKENIKPIYALVDTTIFMKGQTLNDTLIRKNLEEGIYKKGGLTYKRELSGMIKDGKLVTSRSRQYDELTQTMEDTIVVRDMVEGWSYNRAITSKLTKPLVVIRDRTFTQKDFLNSLEEKQRRERSIPVKEYVNAKFDEFVDEQVLKYEDEHLEAKYTDFRMLMKEYRDGILLFELTDEKVWGRAVKDTAGLEAFHTSHADEFMWDTRYDVDIYTCSDAAVAKSLRSLYKKGKRGAELTKALNENDPLALSIETGLYSLEQKPFLSHVTKPGMSSDLALDGRVIVVDMKKIIPPSPKTLDEARGAITAAYQDSLEKAWVSELRAKYPVVIEKDVLYSIK
ncbi:MAG: peptidylprolyl isomerase [Flavobacteriales bacterium]|nr:peptidylprolyl isomerase [Flavobacteriales bacterium]